MQARSSAALAGVLYGLMMGVFFGYQAWSEDRSLMLIAGIVVGSALSCGLLFGLLMYAFSRLPWVRRQIELQPDDLLPGERLIDSRLANLVVDPRSFGLRPFALGDLMFLAGMKDREVIGGALHLTNLRLLFKAHRFNRLRGAVSLFLPSLQSTEARSRWPFRRLRVSTRLADVEFVLRDVAGLQGLLEQARAAYGESEEALLQPMRAELPGIESLQPHAALNALNTLIHRGRIGQQVAESVLTPLSALAGALASEALDRGLADRWAKRMS